MEIPPGVIIFEDPPVHTIHRGLLSRVFTPKRMTALEPKIREFCARGLDPLVGARRVRLHRRPGRPDAHAGHRHAARHPRGGPGGGPRATSTTACAPRPGKPLKALGRTSSTARLFAEYIDWRAEHPSDDLMTELLQAEFEDETGTVRRLTRDEVLTTSNCWPGPATRRPPGSSDGPARCWPTIPTSGVRSTTTGR